jgi:uncharacterized membrane protein YeaQ/YmgE (transglycosylase-associated protein family)
MSLIGWVVLGGIAGWLASIVMKKNNQMGCVTNIIVGIVGAVIGGWLLGSDLTGFNIPSLLTAVVGAVILLAILNFFTGRRS